MLNNSQNLRNRKNQRNHNGRRLKILRLPMSMMNLVSQSFLRKKKNKKKLNLFNRRVDSNLNKIKKISYKRRSKLYSISLRRSEQRENKFRLNSTIILSHLLK